jgi:hypothetical protein
MGAADATLRALAEAVVPGPPHDESFGAAEIDAERFIAHYLEALIPGLAEGVATILDGLASELRSDTTFVDLSLDERGSVLKRLTEHEVQDLRELGDLLMALSFAAVYGEWSGLDEHGALTREPLGWELTGWPGPAEGYPSLMRQKGS